MIIILLDLIYNFNLGEIAKIKKINFIGNKIFRDNTLRNIIISEEDKFWKFITRNKFLDTNRIKCRCFRLKIFIKIEVILMLKLNLQLQLLMMKINLN